MGLVTRFVNTSSVGGNGTTNEETGVNAAYASLQAWNVAEATDLVSATDTHDVWCSAGSTGVADTTSFRPDLAGWTCSPTYRIKVEAYDDPIHGDQKAQMPWSDDIYRLDLAATTAGTGDWQVCMFADQSVDGIQLIGLQFRLTNDTTVYGQTAGVYLDCETGLVDSCHVRHKWVGSADAPTNNIHYYFLFVNSHAVTVRNNFAVEEPIDTYKEWTEYGFSFTSPDSATTYIANNTVYGLNAANYIRGFYQESTGQNWENNVAHVHPDATPTGGQNECFDFVSGAAIDDYNAATDATASGTHSRDNQTFAFVDEPTDLHLAPDDGGARTYGDDLSGAPWSFSHDFDGDDRTTAPSWDIGADQSAQGPDKPTVSIDPDAFFASLTGSTYNDGGGEDHTESQWQVDTDSGFGSPDYDETDIYPGAPPATPAHTAAPLLASTGYYARVRYKNALGEWSAWSTGVPFTTDAGSAPATPTLDSTPSYDSVYLESSEWVDGRTHVESEWEVDESGGDYSTPVAQSLNDGTNLENIDLSGLTASTAYISRVRHRADDGSWSAWSSDESFTTIAAPVGKPDQPELTVVAANTRSADFTSSPFNYPGETYLHSETRLEISEDNTFPADADTFVYSLGPVTEFSGDGLLTDTLYYARVRYKANNGVWSEWSDTESFTTANDLLGTSILKITAPRHGAVVSGAAVQITAEPATLGGATFEIQRSDDYGETWVAVASPATLPYSWDTTALTDGPQHMIRGRWTDGVDNSEWEYRSVIVDNDGDERVFDLPLGDPELDPDSMTKIWNHTNIDWYGSGAVITEGDGLGSQGMSALQITDWFEPNAVDVTIEILQGALGGPFRWQRYPEFCWTGGAIFGKDSEGGHPDTYTGITWTYYQFPIARYGDCHERGKGPGFIEIEVVEEGESKFFLSIPVGDIHCVDYYGDCTKAPRYGLRFRATTIRRNPDGTRDLRLQTALYGMGIDTEDVGPWHWEGVVTTSISCGAVCLARKEITQANGAYAQYTNASAFVYEFSPCDGPDLELPPESCPPPKWDATIFGDDDVTPLFGTVDVDGEIDEPCFSSWRQHPRPYLEVWSRGPEHEIDPIKGTSSIGAVTVGILDKRTDECDQRSGLLTSQIGDGEGFSQYNGRRMVIREHLSDGTIQVVQNGPIYSTRLDPSLVMYRFSVKGPRERERNVAIFTKNETVSVWPPGPVEDYGSLGAVFGGLTVNLLNRAQVGVGTYREGFLAFTSYVEVPGYSTADYTPEMYEIGQAQTVVSGNDWGSFYTQVTVRWRYPGDSDDDWRYVRDIPAGFQADINGINFFMEAWAGGFGFPATSGFRFRLNYPLVFFGEKPTNGAEIQFQILADVVSETYPFFWEGPAGELLKAFYDGELSPTDPNVSYDADAMQTFIDEGPRIRLRREGPEDDGRAWIEPNLLAPFGWALGLTEEGIIAPIDTSVPDNTGSLTVLDNALLMEASWVQDAGRAVPIVRFRYWREYRALVGTEEGSTVTRRGRVYSTGNETWDIVKEPVWIEYLSRSNALLTAKAVTFEPETVRTIGGTLGEALTGGDVLQEWPARLALDRAIDITNRYAFGPELVRTRAIDTAAVRALTIGTWAILDLIWIPNLQTLYRGGQLLVQVLSRKKDAGLAWEFTFLVGGAGAVGLTAPTVEPLTVNEDLTVSVDVGIEAWGYSDGYSDGYGDTAVTVRVEYALSDTEPDASSGSWVLLGLLNAAGSLTTEPLPSGSTVWVRARTERVGFRPSPWGTAVSAEVGHTSAALYALSVEIAADGTPTVQWMENPPTLGLLIEWGIQTIGVTPSYGSFVEIDAKERSVSGHSDGYSAGYRAVSNVPRYYALIGETVEEGQQITVRVTPFDGFWDGEINRAYSDGYSSGYRHIEGPSPKYAFATQEVETVGSGFSDGYDTGYGGS